ncbi:MAG: PEP/pyruvate-binding domain-containing protein, partial [Nitratireductor sp.]
MTTKWTYMFKEGTAEGDASMLELLGMKGANLAQMSKLGLPVPAGFTVAANACERFLNSNQEIEPSLKQAILVSMNELSGHALSGDAKIEFGSSQNPLLVSVRSGSAVSMPGVMNSILNVGLNDESVEALAKQTNDPRFAYDTYRRFIQTYGEIVLEIELADFEEILDSTKAKSDWELDTDITANGWKEIIAEFKALVLQETEAPFPQDPFDQLFSALSAVFSSWNSTRAKMYRTLHGISELHGTAVTIQTMVFGNKGCDSAAGSSLTRDPSNGNKMLYGEYLANAQGEDVSAGMRMPHYISTSSSTDDGHENTLEVKMPKAFEQLEKAAELLEASFKQMQDIEFTIQEGALWLLQTSPAKHSALAGIKIAVDMVEAGIQSKQEAIAKIDASSLTQLLHPSLAENAQRDVLVNGLAASPGAATGAVVFNSTEAEALSNDGKNVILVRAETSPDDIHGMVAAQGILTQRGGTTSHAAVIARGMGKPCVSGASTMRINLEEQELRVGKRVIRRGEVITLDGDQGQVLVGEHEMVQPELSGSFAILMQWADEFRRMKVRSNAEKATDAK